jgi:hypothetical protein
MTLYAKQRRDRLVVPRTFSPSKRDAFGAADARPAHDLRASPDAGAFAATQMFHKSGNRRFGGSGGLRCSYTPISPTKRPKRPRIADDGKYIEKFFRYLFSFVRGD